MILRAVTYLLAAFGALSLLFIFAGVAQTYYEDHWLVRGKR